MSTETFPQTELQRKAVLREINKLLKTADAEGLGHSRSIESMRQSCYDLRQEVRRHVKQHQQHEEKKAARREATKGVAEAREALRVEKEYTRGDLERAYRERVKEVHPDIGGSTSDFLRIQNSYEQLKRRLEGRTVLSDILDDVFDCSPIL